MEKTHGCGLMSGFLIWSQESLPTVIGTKMLADVMDASTGSWNTELVRDLFVEKDDKAAQTRNTSPNQQNNTATTASC